MQLFLLLCGLFASLLAGIPLTEGGHAVDIAVPRGLNMSGEFPDFHSTTLKEIES